MLESIVSGGISISGFGFTLFLMRRWIGRIEDKLDFIDERERKCREDLQERFASRKETSENIAKLSQETRELKGADEYTKGVRNGEKRR